MAWPINARFLSLTANVTRITAALLNAIQDAIYGIIGGSKSVKSLYADGTGDQASALAPGEIYASAGIFGNTTITATTKSVVNTARSSVTTGSGQSLALGETYKDTACFAWGKVTVNGGAPSISFVRGVNVASVSRAGAGRYDITLQTAAPNVLIPIVTPLIDGSGAGGLIMTVDSPLGTAPTTSTFRVRCHDVTGALSDPPGAGTDGFFFVCFAG